MQHLPTWTSQPPAVDVSFESATWLDGPVFTGSPCKNDAASDASSEDAEVVAAHAAGGVAAAGFVPWGKVTAPPRRGLRPRPAAPPPPPAAGRPPRAPLWEPRARRAPPPRRGAKPPPPPADDGVAPRFHARVPAAPAAPAPVAPAVPDDDLDTGPCPICLAEIPAAGSWDDAQYVRLYCCGTRMCLACGERSKAQEKGDTCPCCKAPLPRSLEESFEQTRRVAARGVAWAEHQLAAKYERGMGVGKSISQAQKWYERAAARGYTNSMHSLGVIAHEHRGDVAAAVRYYERAAAGGDAKSMYNLFRIYKDGAPPVAVSYTHLTLPTILLV